MQKYKFRKYSSNYTALFRRERTKLRAILTKEAKIEHTGSTAVPGLGGKGIIDIFIGVRNVKASKLKLEKAGYEYKNKDRERLFFQKDYKYGGRVRRVHLHLTPLNSLQFRQAIALVIYLKKHPKTVKRYAKLKREAAKYAKGKGEKYRKYKDRFIKEITKKAL